VPLTRLRRSAALARQSLIGTRARNGSFSRRLLRPELCVEALDAFVDLTIEAMTPELADYDIDPS
jgi:hypothetical protein